MLTKTVRILVAIDHEGNWVATGASSAQYPGEEKEWIIIDDLSEHMSYHYVTAEIPVPLEMTIVGVIQDARIDG